MNVFSLTRQILPEQKKNLEFQIHIHLITPNNCTNNMSQGLQTIECDTSHFMVQLRKWWNVLPLKSFAVKVSPFDVVS